MDTRKLTVQEIEEFYTLNGIPFPENDLYGYFVSVMMSASLSNVLSVLKMPVGVIALTKSVINPIPNFEQYSKDIVMSFNQVYIDYFCKYFVYENTYPNILSIIWRTIQLMYPLHRMQDLRVFDTFFMFDQSTSLGNLLDISDETLKILNNNKPQGLYSALDDEIYNYHINRGDNMQGYNKYKVNLDPRSNILEIDYTNIKYLLDTLKIDTGSDPKLHFIRLKEIGYDGVYISKSTIHTANAKIANISITDFKYDAYLASWSYSALVIWNMSKIKLDLVNKPLLTMSSFQPIQVLTDTSSYNQTKTSATNLSSYVTDKSSSNSDTSRINQSTKYSLGTSNVDSDEDTSDEGEEDFESDEDDL